MEIPEQQLETWSHQGAVTSSAETHKSIRTALDAYDWPEGMNHEAYLQGSYANSTNIRGNSDVDLVVETGSVFYSNLTDEEKARLNLDPGEFKFREFRSHVIQALQKYYGVAKIDTTGDKSIKVAAEGNRLKTDVIPAILYREYKALRVIAEGITFWSQHTNTQIINYPKRHISNGESKNSQTRTKGVFKKSVRMFKNARERILDSNSTLRPKFPSYFVECLIYNASDSCYKTTFRETYTSVLNYLVEKINANEHTKFVCQNERQWLFGNQSVQWNTEDAVDLVNRLVKLWNEWQ
jgi:hypothetical protein